jgi:site-specific DNA recombinase
VQSRVAALFADPLRLAAQAELAVNPAEIASLLQRGEELCATLKGSPRSTIAELVQQVRVDAGHIEIAVSTAKICELLYLRAAETRPPALILTDTMHLTRTGRVVRLVDDKGQGASPTQDASVTAMLIKARRWWAVLAQGEINVTMLAAQEGVTPSWLVRVVRLAFLSPTVVEAVLDGTLRADIAGTAFVQPGAIPECWSAQQAMYLPAG